MNRLRTIVAVLAVLPVAGAVYVVQRVSKTALGAENSLHSINLLTVVVDRYVAETGQWPQPWENLEAVSVSGEEVPSCFTWPSDETTVREYVIIDFHAKLEEVILSDVNSFDAIRPIGTCYPYRHYRHVARLLETLRSNKKVQFRDREMMNTPNRKPGATSHAGGCDVRS